MYLCFEHKNCVWFALQLVMCVLCCTGYENGSVSLLDVRSPKEDVMAYEEHSRAVHRMIFSSTE